MRCIIIIIIYLNIIDIILPLRNYVGNDDGNNTNNNNIKDNWPDIIRFSWHGDRLLGVNVGRPYVKDESCATNLAVDSDPMKDGSRRGSPDGWRV